MLRLAMLGVVAVSACTAVRADTRSDDGLWTIMDIMPREEQAKQPWVRAAKFKAARLDVAGMGVRLSFAPHETTGPIAGGPATLRITLPDPTGAFVSFDVIEYSMMEPALAARYPTIHTYLGQGIDDPASNIHLDITPLGFHAQVLSPGGAWAIDPYSRDDTATYTSYYAKDLHRAEEWQCHTIADPVAVPAGGYMSRATGTNLRTYRLAMAAVPTFTNFYGGTVDQAQAGIVTGVNRINQVYTNEVAVRYTLVANNTSIIYTTANPGPYTDGTLSTMLGQNQTNLTSVIGSANYDIGHVLSGQNLGGLANLRAVCSTNNKARGGTGLSSPTGDFFWVDYVSHEMGHQCGGNHSFNADDTSQGGTCLPNRNASTAYEPGSGSTIMSYTNLCGSLNRLQNTSDPMFNQGAYAEIAAFIATATCAVSTATGNTPPTVNGGVDRTIPISTPFLMTATASDPNSDSLTFSWEQRDVGAAQPASGTGSEDNGASPLFRVFAPTANLFRYFPRLNNVLNSTVTIGEQMPTVARTMHLRVTARDNRAGGGGVNTDDVNLIVSAAAGPFRVTSPNTAVSWNQTQTVTWDVANTASSPVSCANVRISLSTDGGQTFPIELLAGTPNTGSASITLPDIASTTARIKVEAVNNVFYDLSNVNFTVTHYPGISSPTNVVANPLSVCPGGNSTLSGTVPAGQTIDWYTGGCGTTLVGSGLNISVSPSANTNYYARSRVVSGGQVSSGCAVVLVAVSSSAVITSNPVSSVTVAEGGTVTLHAAASGTIPLTYLWRRNGAGLIDSPTIIGANTPDLTLLSVTPAQSGSYTLRVSNACGSDVTNAANVTITPAPSCGGADFNGDGDIGTDQDIEAFFRCLAGTCCATCGSADFNADGDIGTDQDIEAFFRVLAGGTC